MAGIALSAAGLFSIAVPPETPTEQVLWRVTAGFALLILGFMLGVLPALIEIMGTGE